MAFSRLAGCGADRFQANSAWLQCAVLAHNLIRWTAALGEIRDDHLVVAHHPHPLHRRPWPARQQRRTTHPAPADTMAMGRRLHQRARQASPTPSRARLTAPSRSGAPQSHQRCQPFTTRASLQRATEPFVATRITPPPRSPRRSRRLVLETSTRPPSVDRG